MQDEWEDRDIDLEDEVRPEEVLEQLEAERSRLPWILWGIALVGIGAALFWYLTHRGPSAGPPAPVAKSEPLPPPSGPAEHEEAKEDVPAIALPSLSSSDDLFRKMVSGLTDHPILASLLVPDDLIRKLVVVVANVSNGESPTGQLAYLRPEEPFTVLPAPGGRTVIDPASYHRYDPIADLFVSLDDEGVVKLYRLFRPLLEQAHAELGLADRRDFEDTLSRAIAVLQATPVVEGPIVVRGVSVNYAFGNEALEELTPPQKLLLRTGPDNTRRIQKKLGELATALGITPPSPAREPGSR